MEQVRRWREPVAVVLLIVAGFRLLAGIAAVPVLADAYGSFGTAAMFEADRSFDLVLVLATAAVAASCLLAPPTPRARVIATVALIETAAAVLVSLTYGLLGAVSSSDTPVIELGYVILGAVLPVLAVIALLALLRVPAPVASSQPAVEPSPAPTPTPTPEPPPALPAAWQPEQAAGRVWNTAGDAARGAPGAGWPAEGGGVGWHPIPGPPDPQRPEQR